MAEQKAKRVPAKGQQPHTASAPELPAAVAKEYGLHHLAAEAASKSPTPPGGGTKPEDQNVAPIVTDPKTDAAVDDIIAKESDDLLAAQDAANREAVAPLWEQHGRIVRLFLAWVRNPWAHWISIGVLCLLAGLFVAVPQARYTVLNTVGARSSVGLVVVDNATRLPLKNVTVRIGNQKAQTDIKGEVRLHEVKLGRQQLIVERIAFAKLAKTITVGWGSNPLGTLQLRATGLQYVIEVRDYTADKALEGVEATSGDGLNALSDKKGIITLTVSDTDLTEMIVNIAHKSYRTEQVTLKPSDPKSNKLHLVPAAKAFYMSNAGGKYNLHATDIDGKNNKIILPATGSENSNLSLVAAPAGDWAALVSTRDGVRGKDGYLLRGLTLVSQDGSTVSMVERAEQIRLVDWIGNRIIYQVTVAGASAANNQRNRLISYDYTTNSRVQLAAANYFASVLTIRGIVYYAVGGGDPSAPPVFAKIRPDGTGRQVIWNKEVWTIFRTGFLTLGLQTTDGWFAYTAGGGTPSKDEAARSSSGRVYTESSDGAKAAWVDVRDGKGTVLVSETSGGKEASLTAAEGATYPLRWLNETTLLYRLVTNAETADYAVSTLGGPARKVTDLTNAYGFVQQ